MKDEKQMKLWEQLLCNNTDLRKQLLEELEKDDATEINFHGKFFLNLALLSYAYYKNRDHSLPISDEDADSINALNLWEDEEIEPNHPMIELFQRYWQAHEVTESPHDGYEHAVMTGDTDEFSHLIFPHPLDFYYDDESMMPEDLIVQLLFNAQLYTDEYDDDDACDTDDYDDETRDDGPSCLYEEKDIHVDVDTPQRIRAKWQAVSLFHERLHEDKRLDHDVVESLVGLLVLQYEDPEIQDLLDDFVDAEEKNEPCEEVNQTIYQLIDALTADYEEDDEEDDDNL
ncbi:MAG: hypothetical protein LKF74_01790 [Megasphaera sp.]|jgi:hypothetical protein|nr:hypothetical protein [Megasphaera sp.]MCH4217275.1 hypothetical protein [Megasphaera sp.]